MYRACLAVWKQTPHQMEMALIAEFLKEPNAVWVEDVSGFDFKLSEIEEAVDAVGGYSEDS